MQAEPCMARSQACRDQGKDCLFQAEGPPAREQGPETGASLGVLGRGAGQWLRTGGGILGRQKREWGGPAHVGCRDLCPGTLRTGCGHSDQIWVPKLKAASS